MVTRKPSPDGAAADPVAPPNLQMHDMRQELWSATESDTSTDQIWGDSLRRDVGELSTETAKSEHIPDSLRPGGVRANYSTLEETEKNVWDEPSNQAHTSYPAGTAADTAADTAAGPSQGGLDPSTVPLSLRPGGGGVKRSDTNPFKRRAQDGSGPGSGNLPPPIPNTATSPPMVPFSQLTVHETGATNPWQPALDEKKTESQPPSIPSGPEPDQPKNAWDSVKPSRQPSPGASASPTLISLPSEDGSAAWDEERSKASPSPAFSLPPPHGEVLEDSHAWDDLGNLDKGKSFVTVPLVPNGSSAATIDDWNLVDVDSSQRAPPSSQNTRENHDSAEARRSTPLAQEPQETARRAQVQTGEEPPPPPPRPAANGATETYQIKNINWYDANSSTNPRTSPVLVQNANGPCPLVALVNALTLTTPAGAKTALVETLRSREQVSLGLLLDAVFDELMSPGRNKPDDELPDVGELYTFLQGLHTGMNVNPRFIPTPEVIKAMKRTSLTHLHPTERGDVIPGSFEDTKEMKLYATFSIPLIHGWLPPASDAAYSALERRAASYEDAQNLLFREEELEEKMNSSSGEGLTEEEQEVYQDILTIKSFLSISATQLTPWGIEVMRKATNPGSIAILFRNDHFATLYRHPQTLELLTLVTDAGYASHAEVVWESLVDVNGERAEFFSGDFRVVGGASHQQQSSEGPGRFPDSNAGGNDGWTTVQGRRGRSEQQRHSTGGNDEPPVSPKHEQEDRDLALALQLQEEEDERHRNEQARRQRESRLSEQFIEQQSLQSTGRGGRGGANRGNGGGAATSNRRGSNVPVTMTPSNDARLRGGGSAAGVRGGRGGPGRQQQQTVRSLIPPARNRAVNRPADEGVEDAPPSYEHAAQQTPYVPPQGHPSHPASTGRGSGSASPRASASSQASTNGAGRAPRGRGGGSATAAQGRQRQGVSTSSAATAGGSNSGKDRDCCVM